MICRTLFVLACLTVFQSLAVAQAPANDNFANRVTVPVALPVTLSGTTLNATVEAGEPNHASAFGGNVASNSVWYQWTSSFTGPMTIGAVDASYDLVINVYTGSTLSGLTDVGASDQLVIGDEVVLLDATAGTTYVIAVDGFAPDASVQAGSFDLSLVQFTMPTNDDFANAIVLPSSFEVREAGIYTFGATAEVGEPNHSSAIGGNVASNSIWYRWTAPADALVGVNASVDVATIYDHVVAVYTGSTLTGLTEVGSSDFYLDQPPERVVFDAVANTEYWIALDGYSGDGINFEAGQFVLDVYEVPPNDDFFFAEILSASLDVTVEGTTANGSYELVAGDPPMREPSPAAAIAGNFASSTVWYFWTAPSAAEVTVDVGDVFFDPVVAVYTGGSLAELAEVAAADAGGPGAGEQLEFTAASGTTYVIVVDAYSPDGFPVLGGTFTLELSGTAIGGGTAPFDTWIAQYPTLSGDNAQPDGNPSGDGVSNLMKLVLGLDPTVELAVDPNRANYPELIVTDGGVPALQYTVVPENLGSGAQTISHFGQVSGDLNEWFTGGLLNVGGNTWVAELQVTGVDASFGRIQATIPGA